MYGGGCTRLEGGDGTLAWSVHQLTAQVHGTPSTWSVTRCCASSSSPLQLSLPPKASYPQHQQQQQQQQHQQQQQQAQLHPLATKLACPQAPPFSMHVAALLWSCATPQQQASTKPLSFRRGHRMGQLPQLGARQRPPSYVPVGGGAAGCGMPRHRPSPVMASAPGRAPRASWQRCGVGQQGAW